MCIRDSLEAEQKRKGMTDAEVAEYLGISRITYGAKKKNGSFNRLQIVKLLKLFDCNFEYLFATDDQSLIL